VSQRAILCDTVSRSVSQSRVPREEARRRIVAAASALLRERPFRELTVEAVMAEAGLARTAFYRHFDSLPDVVMSLLDEAVADAEDVAYSAEHPEAPEVLRAMLARGVDLWTEHGHLLAALEEASHHDPVVERAYRAGFERSVESSATMLARGVENGHYTLEPRPIARALLHMNTAYLTDALARDPDPDPDEALRTLWTIWSRILGVPDA
jgi:TetR/AcrR family transcriptional regulator, ethionamide resistance regulator